MARSTVAGEPLRFPAPPAQLEFGTRRREERPCCPTCQGSAWSCSFGPSLKSVGCGIVGQAHGQSCGPIRRAGSIRQIGDASHPVGPVGLDAGTGALLRGRVAMAGVPDDRQPSLPGLRDRIAGRRGLPLLRVLAAEVLADGIRGLPRRQGSVVESFFAVALPCHRVTISPSLSPALALASYALPFCCS